MPRSINGIGTRFYGGSDPRPDHSVITTEWFAVFFIPIIPLRSFRVIRETAGDRFFLFSYSASYKILERLPIVWTQVLKTYLFFVLCCAWWWAVIWTKYKFLSQWHPTLTEQWLLLIFIAPMPFYLLWLRNLYLVQITAHHQAQHKTKNK